MTDNPYVEPSDYLDAQRKSLGEVVLVRDRQFLIPLNQRPWAWRDAKDVQHFLDDFWSILLAFFDPTSSPKWQRRRRVNQPPHFFGTFVFYERPGDNKLEIFDGQQRITAVTMLCSILRDLATEQRDLPGQHQRRADQVYGGFDSWLRPSPTATSARLVPNSLFVGLFDALMIRSHSEVDRRNALRLLPDSERTHAISRKLIRSYTYMRDTVRRELGTQTADENTNFLIAFHDVLCYLFSCVETLIHDEHYSYTVFGCLNTRGEPLTAADNIKNELFKIAPTNQRQRISDAWNRIGSNVPEQQIGEFLRRRHIALYGPCKKREVYDEVKKTEILTQDPAFLIGRWEQDSRILYRILQREAGLTGSDTLKRLEYVFDVLRASLAYIPIFAAAKAFLPDDQDSFSRCVSLVERFVFRALTIGQMDTADLEQKLGEAARRLSAGGTVDQFRTYLRQQADDATFSSQFSTDTERRTGVQYYILSELERHCLGGGRGVVPGDHHSAKNHIEHILPKRLSRDSARLQEWSWARDDVDLHQRLVNRLGNLLVLEGDINKAVGNHAFAVKQSGQYRRSSGRIKTIECYQNSSLPSARSLSDPASWSDWSEAEIKQRQQDMAAHALTVWRI